MQGIPVEAPTELDRRTRAEQHAQEAERLLKGRWISSYVKGQLHATLAVYYSLKSP